MGEAIRGLYHFRFKGICILIFISYALICSSTYVAASTLLRKMLTRSRERQTSAATTCEIKSIFSLFCQKTFFISKTKVERIWFLAYIVFNILFWIRDNEKIQAKCRFCWNKTNFVELHFFIFFFETSKFAKIALIMSCLRPIFSKTIVETYHFCYIKMTGNTSIFQICKI